MRPGPAIGTVSLPLRSVIIVTAVFLPAVAMAWAGARLWFLLALIHTGDYPMPPLYRFFRSPLGMLVFDVITLGSLLGATFLTCLYWGS